MAGVLVMMLVLTGCAPGVVHNPLLLSADEAGGELAPLERNDRYGATFCGPDDPLWYPAGPDDAEYDKNLVRYQQGGRSVVIGIGRARKVSGDPFYSMKRRLAGMCSPDFDDGDPSDEWIVTQLPDYPDNAFAFQSVWWGVDGHPVTKPEAPADPASELTDWVQSSARVYAIVDGYTVVVRIDQKTPEPPSAEDLRVLWERQIAKIEAVAATPR